MEISAMGRKRKPLSQQTSTNNVTLNSSTVSKKKRSNANDPQRRAGTIIRMALKNFMCHSLLEVDLNENVTIIIGRNGSGKSAILTALVVGLGGRASLTNRGNSIKSFIKAGKASGSVEIELHNVGSMAYRPNVYGDKITIIRNLTASGGSAYRIKAADGAVISTQLSEIHNITTSLNIQVDNPVCILNQDTSRNFLNSNNPKNKFTLFMKATKLDSLSEEYKKIILHKRESLRLFEDKQKNFKKLKEELKELKRKIDNHKSIVGIREKIELMRIELLWAKVRDAEDEAQKEEKIVDNLAKQQEKLLDDCENRSKRVEDLKKNIASHTQKINELKETIQVQSRPQWDVKRVIDDLRTKYNDKRREKQLILGTIESKTKEADVLQNEIENANEKMTRVEQEKMQRLRDLKNMNEKIKGMEDHLQTCRNDLYQIRSDISRRDEEKSNLRRDISQLDHQINNEKRSLAALQNESGNTLLLYGRDIPRVQQLIEQNKSRFKHQPRGPLGSYIKLKDKKWAVAVESYLTPGLLGSFTVDNSSDNQLLVQIFNQVWSSGRKPAIITSKFFFKKHDVRNNLVRAPSDCVGIYDVLEIEDAVVANCIVDQAQVEGILLIPSNERAMQLLSHASHVPQNCQQGITIKGDKYYPDPNYKTYGSRYHRAQYLQVDTKEHILQLEHNIKEMTQKKEAMEKQLSAISAEIRDQETKKSQLEEKIKKMDAARTQIRRQLEQLKATAEPEVASVELLESELTEIRETIQQKNAQLATVEEAQKEIKSDIKQNEEKLQNLKAANTDLEERMRELEEQMKEDQIRQKEITTSEEFDKRKAQEFKKKINQAQSELVLKQAAVKKYTEQAMSLGERQETARKICDIANEISELERNVRRIGTSTENAEELLEKYHSMHEKYNELSTLLTCLNDDIKDLTKAVEQRTRHYKLTENYFVTFIKHSFKKIMEVRQFKGSIEINLQEQTLDLVVIPQHGSQGLTTTSNLSGGERSFSTVAFLYSLWQCMEFPFYFLDEFDVYMDKLNRTKVIDILIHHAETHPELQFVFLTPQDVSFVKKASILRLQDPERNNV
ncbi:structural maintenance of chromosomes protein 6 [Tribolium madens]|uniref:structural maintenance of chromosomes protein 6 n=1 Tax=Tribolium madens TaxID=41895 RepID=UPI001CF71EC2|nr:structural maintenance of chromosomes protein 6 [Tribolium madens]